MAVWFGDADPVMPLVAKNWHNVKVLWPRRLIDGRLVWRRNLQCRLVIDFSRPIEESIVYQFRVLDAHYLAWSLQND